jgi:hypothetical protein
MVNTGESIAGADAYMIKGTKKKITRLDPSHHF